MFSVNRALTFFDCIKGFIPVSHFTNHPKWQKNNPVSQPSTNTNQSNHLSKNHSLSFVCFFQKITCYDVFRVPFLQSWKFFQTLEDELSLQNCHFPAWLWEKRYDPMPSKPLSTPTSANLPIQTWKKVVPLYLGKMQPEVGGNSVVFTKHGMVHQNGWGGHGGKLGGEDRRISLESFLFILQD